MNYEQLLTKLPDMIAEKVSLQRIGLKAIAIIRERTLAGEFLDKPGADARITNSQPEYSTKPMPVPYRKYVNLYGKPDRDTVVYRKNGHVMVLIPGGYKEYKRKSGKVSDFVNMNWTGKMMRNLGLTERENAVMIDMRDSRSKKIAEYHNISGAGKNKIKHPFMGLTNKEAGQLTKEIEPMINSLLNSLS